MEIRLPRRGMTSALARGRVEKDRQRESEREARRAQRSAPTAAAEIYLEASPELTPTTWAADASESGLDRDAAVAALGEIETLRSVAPDEWTDDEGRLHAII